MRGLTARRGGNEHSLNYHVVGERCMNLTMMELLSDLELDRIVMPRHDGDLDRQNKQTRYVLHARGIFGISTHT